jgi:hypothetical protein
MTDQLDFSDRWEPRARRFDLRCIGHIAVTTIAGVVAWLGLMAVAFGIGMCGLFGEVCTSAENSGQHLAVVSAFVVLGASICAAAALGAWRSWVATAFGVAALWGAAITIGLVANSMASAH